MTTLNELTDAQLLDDTRLCVKRTHALDAELLLLLGEIDSRRLFAERAFPSMFAFCTGELRATSRRSSSARSTCSSKR